MTRVAIISDQHFNRSSRWEEHIRIMSWIADDLRSRQPDAILLGGDIYERSPGPEEVRAACEWLIALASIAPVIGVQGNHDPTDSTVPFNHLEVKHFIRFYEEPAVHVCSWGSIACLPWPRRAQLLQSIPYGVSRDESNQIAADALRAVLLGLGQEMDEVPGVRVFLGHVQLRAATVSSGQPLVPGSDFELGLEDLALLNADAYLLGHIHRGSMGENEINGAPVFYPGSSRRTSYGELEPKGYAVVDFDLEGGPGHPTFIETPCRRMFLLDDEWGLNEDTGRYEWLAGLHGEPDRSELQDAAVRFRYTVDANQRDAARAAVVDVLEYLRLRGVAETKVEERVIAMSKARAPEIAKAATLEEQLAAFFKVRGIEVSPERMARIGSKLGQIQGAA